jgi:[ribosomal protein S5]-alanine N-acetyltransferase
VIQQSPSLYSVTVGAQQCTKKTLSARDRNLYALPVVLAFEDLASYNAYFLGGGTMQNPFLIGEKLYLRSLERGDAAQLSTWINNREVARFLKSHRPVNLQNEEEFIESSCKSKEELVFGIVTKDNDRLIGCTGLHGFDQINRHCFFGIFIGDTAQWGKGYGTEATRIVTRYAFESLNFNRVWLHVYDFNERGIKTYEKVGFKREGVLRQHTYRDGKYHDVFSMAILRSDWDEMWRPPAVKKLVPAF